MYKLPLGLVDDAYIYLRYGRNLHDGLGLVFNAGERVEGFTAPLWTMLCSLLFHFDPEPSALLGRLSVFSGLLAIALAGLAARRLGLRLFWLAPLMLALNPPFICWSASGMDAAFFACFLLAHALLLSHEWRCGRRLILSGRMTGLLFAVRLESLLVGAASVAFIILDPGCDRSQRLGRINSFLAGWIPPVLAISLARHAYYDAWLPNTYYAKAGGGDGSWFGTGWAMHGPSGLRIWRGLRPSP